MTQTRIAKIGNSLTVRLPAALARDLDLHEGDVVTLRRHASALIIEPSPHAQFAAMLETVKEPEREFATGPAVGEEIVG
jgi:antitoxin component of MazEF toxin-antitoxin module